MQNMTNITHARTSMHANAHARTDMWWQQLSAARASGCLFTGSSSSSYNHSILTKDADSRAGHIPNTYAPHPQPPPPSSHPSHTHRFQSNFRELKRQQTNSHYLLETVVMTSRRLQQRATALVTLNNVKAVCRGGGWRVWGGQKAFDFPTVSWRTGQIFVWAAVRRARLPLAPQMCLLKWAQRVDSFCFVTTSFAVFTSTDYYPEISGNKMKTEISIKWRSETIWSRLQGMFIFFYSSLAPNWWKHTHTKNPIRQDFELPVSVDASSTGGTSLSLSCNYNTIMELQE